MIATTRPSPPLRVWQLEKEADPEFKSTDARQVLQLLQAARTRKAAQEKAEKAKWSKVRPCVEGEGGGGWRA